MGECVEGIHVCGGGGCGRLEEEMRWCVCADYASVLSVSLLGPVYLMLQVVVMQAYKNNSSVPIEAKYVFPLDDMAAGICTICTSNVNVY